MKLYPGLKVGSLTLIQTVRVNRQDPPNRRHKWRVECVCGKRLTVPQYYLTRANPKTSCGCQNKTIRTNFNQEYRIWLMMHKRTEDPTHISYKHYGGRGIKVCEEWHKDRGIEGFEAFLKFVGPRPTPHHTIDRINNDLGYQPYQPNGERQVRWATASQQRQNQRPTQGRERGRGLNGHAQNP